MYPSLPLSPQVFAILTALVEERTGLHFAHSELELFRDKVSARALEAGFQTLLDYYYFLRYDPGGTEELQALAEALVVGETYFFREFDQLKVLARELIPQLLEKQKRVRVWSAACATGEEPLTLAMMLDAQGLLPRVELVASDLSEVALARAKKGQYGRRSVRILPEPALFQRYVEQKGDQYSVRPELLSAVKFQQLNLLDEQAVRSLGRFDFILCRNVLIYFRDDTAVRVLDHLSQALEPGGFLLVSVSESLMRFGTRFVCEEHGGAFVYRKVAK